MSIIQAAELLGQHLAGLQWVKSVGYMGNTITVAMYHMCDDTLYLKYHGHPVRYYVDRDTGCPHE